MGGNPRAGRPHVQRPSPLQQVHLTRPISQAPTASGLVRDPQFWKRFSVAVHAAEGDVELGSTKSRSNSSGSGSSAGIEKNSGQGDQWLDQQRREKRRCRILCMSITLAVLLVIIAGGVVGWYFTHEWKQSHSTSS